MINISLNFFKLLSAKWKRSASHSPFSGHGEVDSPTLNGGYLPALFFYDDMLVGQYMIELLNGIAAGPSDLNVFDHQRLSDTNMLH